MLTYICVIPRAWGKVSSGGEYNKANGHTKESVSSIFMTIVSFTVSFD